ncbi:MAG: GCN5-related N-acetyltransferase [Candidatus Gottesmanbacteria bacterium GW2011_GWA1_43_11]|uniref:GCN5-related N-acetyltransferase n=1 Tax=Candidatus Gottesmanbacteria bacterium GW2011_GWA1_43_11 TaxID=1618436 RepID=A0A0G1ELF3_9BACT|nr:MAG: GCN5-related N-acetyltransferase [Candidatus Gottesmanbacteria bacterium GW2011_GWA1_43_11]
MEIRIAKPEDTDQILALQTQIYRTEKIADGAKEALEKQMSDETCEVLVAVDSGKIISTCAIYYIEVPVRNRPYAFLEGLVVDESARGHGVGTKMFDKILELARARNCYKIIFTSGADRTDAHKLYEKLGFKKWGLEFRMDL